MAERKTTSGTATQPKTLLNRFFSRRTAVLFLFASMTTFYIAYKAYDFVLYGNHTTCELIYSRLDDEYSHSTANEVLSNFYLRSNQTASNNKAYKDCNLAFVHLPKSGGTSVEELLLSQIAQDSNLVSWRLFNPRQRLVGHCADMLDAAAYADSTTERMLFYSKRSFGMHRYVVRSRPFAYITWFRDPVTRVVSAYHYLKKMRPYYLQLYPHYIYDTKNLTECLLKSKDVQLEDIDNLATRLLQFGDRQVDTRFENCCGSYMPAYPMESKHFLVAKRNLEEMFAFIGLLEDFKTSQDMLCNMLGIKLPGADVHTNSNKHHKSITDFERKEIERRNYWDIKLYNYAKSLYVKEKENYLKSLSKNTS